jgi:hypothetical protein
VHMAARRMQSPDRDREVLLDTLLNSLVAERYVRGPLLLTIVDELSAKASLAAAAAGRMLLEAIESGEMIEAEFSRQVEALRRLVHRDA